MSLLLLDKDMLPLTELIIILSVPAMFVYFNDIFLSIELKYIPLLKL